MTGIVIRIMYKTDHYNWYHYYAVVNPDRKLAMELRFRQLLCNDIIDISSLKPVAVIVIIH